MTSTLRVLQCCVTINCADAESHDLICSAYSAFLTTRELESHHHLTCDIRPAPVGEGWVLEYEDSKIYCPSTADLIYDFEKAMTIWLQLSRSELFFIHACALSIDNRCIVIAGASGSGKSTLAWTLCQLGFNYLSDELAPIEPETMRVEPYPHALCMKTEPPGGAILPNSTLVTDATMHIPASELPMHPLEQPSRIGAFVFIESIKHDGALKVDSIGASEAAIRLYSNGLNQLAHSGDGLPTASRIAQRIPSFLFSEGSVEERVLAIQEVANKTFK